MENIKELVSVVITTYKRPLNILQRAANSVLAQSYKNIELIIVNDSPDFEESDKIIEWVKEKGVTIINNKETKGAGYSRNVGIKNAKGEYIAFLDDDDEWLPNKLESIIPLFVNNIGLVYCDLLFDSNGKRKVVKMSQYSKEETIAQLLYRNYIGGFSGPVMKKSFVVQAGGMDESLLSSQDADLWRRLALICDFCCIHEPLVIYYNSEVSITRNAKRRLQGTISLINKYASLYEKYPAIRKKHIRRCVINYSSEGWFSESVQLIHETCKGLDKFVAYCYIPYALVRKTLKQII